MPVWLCKEFPPGTDHFKPKGPVSQLKALSRKTRRTDQMMMVCERYADKEVLYIWLAEDSWGEFFPDFERTNKPQSERPELLLAERNLYLAHFPREQSKT